MSRGAGDARPGPESAGQDRPGTNRPPEEKPPFEPQREEDRLNGIFSQIDSEYEGSRTGAANALRNWMEKHRFREHGLQIRLTLRGTSAERTLRVLDEQESRIKAMGAELRDARLLLSAADRRRLARQQKATGESFHAELVQAAIGHLYGGRAKTLPRGAAKAMAAVLKCSDAAVREMLGKRRPVPRSCVDAILAAAPLPQPKASQRKPRQGTARKEQEKLPLDPRPGADAGAGATTPAE